MLCLLIAELAFHHHLSTHSVQARVVAKRSKPTTRVTAVYTATFELAGGRRVDFSLKSWQYSELDEEDEEDEGILKYRATDFLGFKRSE